MLQGSKGRSWMLAKNGQPSCTTPLVTAEGMEGRGGPILCVKIVRGQSTIQVICEAPSVSLRPRGGSLKWAFWELRLPGHSGGTAGCANQEAATAMPGMLPAAVSTPSCGGEYAGCCLSVPQTASGMRLLPQFLIHLLSGLNTLVALIIMEDYSCQLQV